MIMKKGELQIMFRRYLKKENRTFNKFRFVEIDGRQMYLNEYEIRFIQILAHDCEDKNWDEFKRRFVIYDGSTKRGHKPMIWDDKRKGFFLSPFCDDLFKLNGFLAFEL